MAAPTLTRQPVSPNPDVTKHIMSWSTESDASPANIESLTVEGVPVVVNNVLQTSDFIGTISANGANGFDVDVLAKQDPWGSLPGIDWSIRFDNGIEVTIVGTIAPAREENVGDGWALDGDGNNIKTRDGRLKRDPTVTTEAIIRLKVHRGKWPFDLDIGSLFWTIKTTTDAKKKAEPYARQALQPMIESGKISEISVSNVQVQEPDGAMYVEISVLPVGGKNAVFLGRFQLGE